MVKNAFKPVPKLDSAGIGRAFNADQAVDISNFRAFISGRYRRAVIFSACFINIIIWLLVLIKVRFDAKPIPLHFNAVYGIDYVDSGLKLFQLPLIGLLLISANVFLSWKLARVDRFLSRIMNYFSILVQCFLLLAVTAVIYLNR